MAKTVIIIHLFLSFGAYESGAISGSMVRSHIGENDWKIGISSVKCTQMVYFNSSLSIGCWQYMMIIRWLALPITQLTITARGHIFCRVKRWHTHTLPVLTFHLFISLSLSLTHSGSCVKQTKRWLINWKRTLFFRCCCSSVVALGLICGKHEENGTMPILAEEHWIEEAHISGCSLHAVYIVMLNKCLIKSFQSF